MPEPAYLRITLNAESQYVPQAMLRLQVTLDTDASEEQLATLLRLTERYCVVSQTLTHPPALAITSKSAAP